MDGDDFLDRRNEQLQREGTGLPLAARFQALERDGLARLAMVLAAIVDEMGGTVDVSLDVVMGQSGRIIDTELMVDGDLVRVTVRP